MIKFYNKFYNKKYTYTLHLNAIKLALKNAKFVIHTFQEGHPLREGNFSGLNISTVAVDEQAAFQRRNYNKSMSNR